MIRAKCCDIVRGPARTYRHIINKPIVRIARPVCIGHNIYASGDGDTIVGLRGGGEMYDRRRIGIDGKRSFRHTTFRIRNLKGIGARKYGNGIQVTDDKFIFIVPYMIQARLRGGQHHHFIGTGRCWT